VIPTSPGTGSESSPLFHKRSPNEPPSNTHPPSGAQQAVSIGSPTSMRAISFQSVVDHSLAAPSEGIDNNREPSLLSAKHRTPVVWAVSRSTNLPEAVSVTTMVRSSEADTSNAALEVNTKAFTGAVWASTMRVTLPSPALHKTIPGNDINRVPTFSGSSNRSGIYPAPESLRFSQSSPWLVMRSLLRLAIKSAWALGIFPIFIPPNEESGESRPPDEFDISAWTSIQTTSPFDQGKSLQNRDEHRPKEWCAKFMSIPSFAAYHSIVRLRPSSNPTSGSYAVRCVPA
jgi:hypothetical protein